MTIKSLDDIEKERNERERKEFKEDVKEDIGDILNSVFGTPKKIKKKISIIKWLGILFLFFFLLILVLGSIWLLRELIRSLFFGS